MEFNSDTLEKADKTGKKRDELRGKVLTLKDLVDYQDGTVVSRMIVNMKAGLITLFFHLTRTKDYLNTQPPMMPSSPFWMENVRYGFRV